MEAIASSCTLTSSRLPCTLTSHRLPCTLTSRRLPSTAFRAELFRPGPISRMRHFPCTLTSRRLPCTLTSRRLPCTLTSRRLPCTLTSRRLPCMLTSRRLPPITRRPLSDEQELSPGRDLVHADQPSTANRAELVSAGTYFSYASFPRPLSDEQELSPERDLVHADQPSTACRAELVSAGSFNYDRSQCTLTSRRLPDPFGRTRCTLTSRRLPCTLTSRRLPIGLNYFGREVPFGRTRCTLTSRRLPCTLTSRRLPCTLTSLSAGTNFSYASFPRPLSDEQELSPGRDLMHADQPSTACRAELVSAGSFNKNRSQCTLTSRRLPCTLTSRRLPIGLNYTLTSRRLPCTLTSRRLPCTLTSRRLPCTLTSLSAGTYFSYASFPRPLSDEQELSPGRDLVHADQPSTASYYAPCLPGPFRTNKAPFGRTRCTLTSRRLPFRLGLLIKNRRISRHFAWPLSDEQAPGSDHVHADQPGPFGRTRCTLTSRRLPIGLKRPLSDKQELSPGSDLVHTELTLAACRADLISALCFN
ncbi:hypothetical protein DPMN_137280 [Dreissena polymorpha]|uniref:Uncharacterized protein n=1 Tax=Dreissena polymorpha TaxID=45954 RepID=A0A9D4G5G5_DREPO|nr:hypothetical protein DPMN_137280 [Dreissena polymorpha]